MFIDPKGTIVRRAQLRQSPTMEELKTMNSDPSSNLPRIITKKELRLIVPYTPQHILRLEKQGKFPKRIQIGARRVGWYLVELERWLDQRARGTPPPVGYSSKRTAR